MRGKSRDKDDNDTASSLAGRGKRRSKSSGSRSAKGGPDSRQDPSAKPSRRGSVVKRIRQSRFMKEPGRIMGPRLLFIASVAVLLTFGLIMVYSASSITAYNDFHDAAYYVKRQVTFMAIGIVACIACAKIPYRFWCSPTVFVVLWFITVLLLTATAFGLGVSALGAERSIMIAGFALQPAEFAKIVILMTCASLFELWHEGKFEFRHFIGILAVATLVPLILIYRQPDLGTAIILAVGFLALCLLAQVPLKPIAIIIGALVLYVVFACVTQPYHLERIITIRGSTRRATATNPCSRCTPSARAGCSVPASACRGRSTSTCRMPTPTSSSPSSARSSASSAPRRSWPSSACSSSPAYRSRGVPPICTVATSPVP